MRQVQANQAKIYFTITLGLIFAGCAKPNFQSKKIETISKSSVFGGEAVVGSGSDGGIQDVQTHASTQPEEQMRNQAAQLQYIVQTQAAEQSQNQVVAGAGSDSGVETGAGSDSGSQASVSADSDKNVSQNVASAGDDGGQTSSTTAQEPEKVAPVITTASPVIQQIVSPLANQPYQSPIAAPPKRFLTLETQFVCSTSLSQTIGMNLSNATEVRVQIGIMELNNTRNVMCDLTMGVKDGLLENKKVDLSSCDLYGSQEYFIEITDATHSKDIVYSNKEFFVEWDGTMREQIEIIADVNPDQQYPNQQTTLVDRVADPNIVCNKRVTPLMIDFTPVGQENLGLQMSDPNDGVLFDILGLNSFPFAHAKKRISWPQNSNYMFLGIRNKNGVIAGIDQLFGDNTYGPDRKFAANGYAALAKWDRNRDGFIDRKDPIYSRLVVWSDVNKDAVSVHREIRSLASMRVERLDLNYDKDYLERDKYGNESRYKSVAVMKDGSQRLLFDLWFIMKNLD